MGPGSTPSLGRQLEAHEVADEHQVEQLRQRAVALGAHLVHAGHDLVEDVGDRASKRRDTCGCSWSWRSCTSVNTWRVTSPCWPQPQISLWHSSGTTLAKAGTLAFSLQLRLPARAAATPPRASPP